MKPFIGFIAAVFTAAAMGALADDRGGRADVSHRSGPGAEVRLVALASDLGGPEAGLYTPAEIGKAEGIAMTERGPGAEARYPTGDGSARTGGTGPIRVASLGAVMPAVESASAPDGSKASLPLMPDENLAFFDLLAWLVGAVGFILVWMLSVIWILSGVRRFRTARS